MARIVLVLDLDTDPRLTDPHEAIEDVLAHGESLPTFEPGMAFFVEDKFEGTFVSCEWHGPKEFMRPADHDDRIKHMQARAEWELGSGGYASMLFTAYENHIVDGERLRKEIAE